MLVYISLIIMPDLRVVREAVSLPLLDHCARAQDEVCEDAPVFSSTPPSTPPLYLHPHPCLNQSYCCLNLNEWISDVISISTVHMQSLLQNQYW